MGEGFSNAIVGGVGKLIRAFIQSPNYLAGKTGWSINKDGSVDFNNGAFRSNVIVTDNAGNPITIIDANGVKVQSAPNGSSYVFITPYGGIPEIHLKTSGVDYDGVIQSSGNPTQGGTLTLQPAAPAGKNVPTLQMASDGAAGNGTFFNVFSGQVSFKNAVGSVSLLAIDANGASLGVPLKLMTSAGTVETWHPVGFLNGWSNLGGAYVTMQYRKVATPPNSVQLVGVMNIGTKVAGTVIGNLPVGYRPLNTVRVPVSSNGSNSGGQTPAFDILANGDIIVASGTGFPAASTDCEVNAIVPLDA